MRGHDRNVTAVLMEPPDRPVAGSRQVIVSAVVVGHEPLFRRGCTTTPGAGLAAIMFSARDARVFAAPVPHGIPRGSV